MLRPPNIPPIPERKPIEPTKLDDFFFSAQEQIIKTTPVGGGGGDIQFPFQLQDVSDPEADPPVPKVNVRYGLCQDILPTDVATDITIGDDATTYFYLDVEVDIDGAIVGVDLIDSTSPQPADADYHAYITLGNAVTVDGVITVLNQAVTHSLRYAVCGRLLDDETDPPTLVDRGTYNFWGV